MSFRLALIDLYREAVESQSPGLRVLQPWEAKVEIDNQPQRGCVRVTEPHPGFRIDLRLTPRVAATLGFET